MRLIRKEIIIFFLLITLFSTTTVFGFSNTDSDKEKENANMQIPTEETVFASIKDLVTRSNLIILAEVKRVEIDGEDINYALSWIEQIFKGRSTAGINIEFKVNSMAGDTARNLDFKAGDKGIFYLTTDNKSVYRIVDGRCAYLPLRDNKLYFKDLNISFDKYIAKLKDVIATLPKSPIELQQEKAVEIAKSKVKQFGYSAEKMMADIDENNIRWERYISDGNLFEYHPDLKVKLQNRNYWAIYFSPKEYGILDGDLWVIVDKKTFNVLFTVPDWGSLKF